MCSWENGLFVSRTYGSEYAVSKICFSPDFNITDSGVTFNHANGMGYDPSTNRLFICKLSSLSGTDGCDLSCDYSFYIVDGTTFEIVQTINLYDVVTEVCPQSIGISGITYNSSNNKIYVFTRKPERYVIEINDDYSYSDSFFICEDNDEGLFGDIASFDDYILTCFWNTSKSDFSNIVSFYDLSGNFIRDVELFGVTHIESIDIYDGRLVANFNDLSSDAGTKVYSVPLPDITQTDAI